MSEKIQFKNSFLSILDDAVGRTWIEDDTLVLAVDHVLNGTSDMRAVYFGLLIYVCGTKVSDVSRMHIEMVSKLGYYRKLTQLEIFVSERCAIGLRSFLRGQSDKSLSKINISAIPTVKLLNLFVVQSGYNISIADTAFRYMLPDMFNWHLFTVALRENNSDVEILNIPTPRWFISLFKTDMDSRLIPYRCKTYLDGTKITRLRLYYRDGDESDIFDADGALQLLMHILNMEAKYTIARNYTAVKVVHLLKMIPESDACELCRSYTWQPIWIMKIIMENIKSFDIDKTLHASLKDNIACSALLIARNQALPDWFFSEHLDGMFHQDDLIDPDAFYNFMYRKCY